MRESEEVVSEGRDVSQSLNCGIDAIGLVQIVETDESRQVAAPKQISRQVMLFINDGYVVWLEGWVQCCRNVSEGRILHLIIIRKAVEGTIQ